ncbi:hypothetical protein, partial [Pseudomonas syringae]
VKPYENQLQPPASVAGFAGIRTLRSTELSTTQLSLSACPTLAAFTNLGSGNAAELSGSLIHLFSRVAGSL